MSWVSPTCASASRSGLPMPVAAKLASSASRACRFIASRWSSGTPSISQMIVTESGLA